jgi:hypothetical protein
MAIAIRKAWAFDPATGIFWETEHGPVGGDEVNIIEPGKNYGWGMATFGIEPGIGRLHATGVTDPITFFQSLHRSSRHHLLYRRRYPGWKGNLFVTGMVGERLDPHGDQGPPDREPGNLIQGYGRIRDVVQWSRRLLYLLLQEHEWRSQGRFDRPSGARENKDARLPSKRRTAHWRAVMTRVELKRRNFLTGAGRVRLRRADLACSRLGAGKIEIEDHGIRLVKLTPKHPAPTYTPAPAPGRRKGWKCRPAQHLSGISATRSLFAAKNVPGFTVEITTDKGITGYGEGGAAAARW